MSFSSGVSRMACILTGFVFCCVGVWVMFFRSAGFVKTTAEIVSIEEHYDPLEETADYTVTVTYTVNGTRYTEELGGYMFYYRTGNSITVLYDPENPSVVHGTSGLFGIAFIAVGLILLAGVLFPALLRRG